MYILQSATISPEVVAVFALIAQKTDLAPGPGGSRITPIKDAPFELLGIDMPGKAMFVVLYPSSQLVAHRDPPIPDLRYHVPIIVPPGNWVFHDGLWQQLVVGNIYQMDPTKEHGAVNWGSEIRIHLVVDTV